MTGELEERASELITRIDEIGGAVAAIEAGWVQAEIEAAAYGGTSDGGVGRARDRRRQRERRGGERADRAAPARPGVGAPSGRANPPVRAERNAAEAERTLARVREAARGTENMLPPIKEALAAMCTVGEVCGVLREEWGTYDQVKTVARITLAGQGDLAASP